ncbi:MAG: protein kinase, partial [Candidatus Eremiobacterota bacterium]
MSRELLPGTRLKNEAYIVTRTLSYDGRGGVYHVRDQATGENRVLKEVLPDSELDADRLLGLGLEVQERMLVYRSLEHPALARVMDYFCEGRRQYFVMERVDGITLKALADMSVTRLPEPQVLEWAVQLARAIHYLHNRPKPVAFGGLDPSHVMILPDEKLRMVNFGLSRFFRVRRVQGRGPVLPEARTTREWQDDLRADFADFARTLIYLLTGEEAGPLGLKPGLASPALTSLVNAILHADEAPVVSFEELAVRLHQILHPPKPVVRAPARPWVALIDYGRLTEDLLSRVLGQPLPVLLSTAFSLLLTVTLLGYLTLRPATARNGPAVYVAAGREILMLGAIDRKVVTRLTLPQRVQDLAVHGNRMYASLADGNRIVVLDTLRNREVGSIRVESLPEKL